MLFRDIGIYRAECKRFRKEYPGELSIGNSAAFFFPWRRSLRGNSDALADEIPWLTFPAIRFLDHIINREVRVYEYGSGGSTLYFSRKAREVFSVEHDPAWYGRVGALLERRGRDNVAIRLVKPEYEESAAGRDSSDPNAYVSGSGEFQGYSFKTYASDIDSYTDGFFDVILIDGRARPSCFRHSLPKVKPNGYIVWDNTDREHYSRTIRSVSDEFSFLDFPGPSPYVNFFTRTSAWQRRS
jgi:hypothetical protein